MATRTGMQIRKKPKILLSSFSNEERQELSNKIRSIGGIIYESSNYTSCASHIICKAPSRGEKFLCACAEGKWILSRSYVDSSFAKGQWLDEEDFEWTAEKATPNMDNQLKQLFTLPRKWRLRREQQNNRIFTGWTVVLVFANKRKQDGFKRLIEAGGGRVLMLKTYRNITERQIKYVVSENKDAKELRPFTRANIPIIPCESLPGFIIQASVDQPNIKDEVGDKERVEKSAQTKRVGEKSIDCKKKFPLQQTKKQTDLKAFFIPLKDVNKEKKPVINDIQKKESKEEGNSAGVNDAMEPLKAETRNEGALNSRCERGFHTVSESKSFPPACADGSSTCLPLPGKVNSQTRVDLVDLEMTESRVVKEEEIISSGSSGGRLTVENAASILKRFSYKQEEGCDEEKEAFAKRGVEEDCAEGCFRGTKQRKCRKSIKVIDLESTERDSKRDMSPGCSDEKEKLAKCNDLIPVDVIEDACGREEGPSKARRGYLSPNKARACGGAKEVVSVNIEETEDVKKKDELIHIKSVASSVDNPAKKSKRARSTKDKVYERVIDHNTPRNVPMTRNTSKKRSLISTATQSTDDNYGDVSESKMPTKKSKIEEDCDFGNSEKPTDELALNLQNNFLLAVDENTEQDIVRHSLHRNGMDCVEGKLEDGHKHIAAKMMSGYMSPSCYLPPTLIYTLMQMLQYPDDSFTIEIVTEISCLLNRHLILHPTSVLRDVYLSALRKPIIGTVTDFIETTDAFSYLIEVINEVKGELTDERIIDKNTTDRKIKEQMKFDVLKRESKMALLRFIAGIFEADFLSCSKKTSLKGKSKSILMQVLWPTTDAIGGGLQLKEFLNLTLDVTLSSLKNIHLAALKSIVFSLLRIIAGCCELSDKHSLKTSYGPACNSLVSELFLCVDPMVKDIGPRQLSFLRGLLDAMEPRWLSARLCDNIIGRYDASSLPGEIRSWFSKPLSLDKIVSCYFHLIPRFSGGQHEEETIGKKAKKPLAVIGNSSSESSRLNSGNPQSTKANVKRNIRGESQLHTACIKNRPSLVKQLLCQGIDPNLKDNAGWTALHEASSYGHYECVAELLKCRDVDIYAVNGVTALHDAVANNHLNVAKLLLHHGGSKLYRMTSNMDKSTFDYARTIEMKKLLQNISDNHTKNDLKHPSKTICCSDEEIQVYILLLSILMRYFASSVETNNHYNEERIQELEQRIKNLNSSFNFNDTMLSSVLKCFYM